MYTATATGVPKATQSNFKPGDVNTDTIVNGLDLSVVLTNYGRSNVGSAYGDVNNDGTVGATDLGQVLTNYGR